MSENDASLENKAKRRAGTTSMFSTRRSLLYFGSSFVLGLLAVLLGLLSGWWLYWQDLFQSVVASWLYWPVAFVEQ